jgi:PAS domain S-box-containing protein
MSMLEESKIIDGVDAFKIAFEEIASLTGVDFLKALVQNISKSLDVDAAWVTEYDEETNMLVADAFWYKNKFIDSYYFNLEGTPCEKSIKENTLVYVPENIVNLFPAKTNTALRQVAAVSYIGIPLMDIDNSLLGNLAVMHSQPLPRDKKILDAFRVFGARAQAELQRIRREKEIEHREQQLIGLVNSVQYCLLNIDENGRILFFNAKASDLFGINEDQLSNNNLRNFISGDDWNKIIKVMKEMFDQDMKKHFQEIPDEIEIVLNQKKKILVKATLSRYKFKSQTYFVINLFDTSSDNAFAGQSRSNREGYEGDEIYELKSNSQIVGESEQIKKLFQNIYLVAHTDATVLISGETGTGKELIAKNIHNASNRKDKALITVNCGAIPANLIESELFGHEKGAFTSAVSDRKGRFLLANGGTIFLDEIGDLSLDLQVKLLRVLQEGEVQPVGSSKTIKVDVRVIAATHRDLIELTKQGKFREDLFYRLNVFPIYSPALRERGDDIILLANLFIENFARRESKKINGLTVVQKKILKSYPWPGNVRELKNIIERTVIISQDGNIELSQTLGMSNTRAIVNNFEPAEDRIMTKEEIIDLERNNILKALEACNWRVSGKDGAAKLLNMVPSTLSSRITALGIRKR